MRAMADGGGREERRLARLFQFEPGYISQKRISKSACWQYPKGACSLLFGRKTLWAEHRCSFICLNIVIWCHLIAITWS